MLIGEPGEVVEKIVRTGVAPGILGHR